MKKILSILIILILTATNFSFAKSTNNDFTKNCVYLELLGQGILGSINYEYRFANHWSGRVGFTKEGIFIPIGMDIDIKGAPLMINYLTGRGSHHMEFGLGVFAAWVKGDDFWGIDVDTEEEFMPLYTATAGYRYQPRKNGFIYKLSITPFVNGNGNGTLWAGLSIGYTF